MRLLVTFLFIALIPCLPLQAQDLDGREIYINNCAGCHGVGARGDGPLAPLISVDVPDLTVLSARHGGEFPFAEVVLRIDGRVQMRGHGDPMPVFGGMLEGESAVLDTARGDPITTKASVLAVADYLKLLQQ